MRTSCCLLLLCVAAVPARAQGKTEPLAAKVKVSIDRGVTALLAKQSAGNWENRRIIPQGQKGGVSALATLALLTAGLPKDDPKMVAALEYVRKLQSDQVYVVALQTMVLAEANMPQDRELLRKNVRWLIDARVMKGNRLEGWSYGFKEAVPRHNASTTQYAVLGLWAAKQANVEVERAVWESIRDHYLRTQSKDGYWVYDPAEVFTDTKGFRAPSLTMTTAGVCGLLIAGMELNAGREQLRKDGTAKNCGEYDEDVPAALGLRWLSKHFVLRPDTRVFYHLYGLERIGRVSGQRFLGEHDWYREGCAYLTRNDVQDENGTWHLPGGFDDDEVISTSFALLFLSKGRTPLLISKTVHGAWPRPAPGDPRFDTDWNNDRNDLRHLVAFARKELFPDLTLGWQSFDIQFAAEGHGGGREPDQEAEVVSEMLQSPIFYITGHQSPLLRFTDTEKKFLKRFVENGGLIVAEACCNSPAFDKGFRDLFKHEKMWGNDAELTPLDANHPVWSSHFPVTPGDPYKLMGLQLGCKTVVIYSPQDLSCQWEAGPPKRDEPGRKAQAFRIGTNIIAYATGKQPPRPRLSDSDVARDDKNAVRSPFKRRHLEIGQVYWPSPTGDWQPAPKAMRKVLADVRGHANLDVVLEPKKVRLGDENVVQYKFLYLHGKGDFKGPADLDHLRFDLDTGGLLFADACCGDEAFDKAFRKFLETLYPDRKLEQLGPKDKVFTDDRNGPSLTADTIRGRTEAKGAPRPMAPWLEGIKGDDGRWLVLYSKYDVGCALEGHQSLGCLGYDPPSALRIARAALLYNVRPWCEPPA